MSKHKEFPEQADDLSSKRHFKEGMHYHISLHLLGISASQALTWCSTQGIIHLHNNQQDRYCGLVMSEDVEAHFDLPMDSQLVSGVLGFYRGPTQKSTLITTMPHCLPT